MAQKMKAIYRFMLWVFGTIIAAGSLVGFTTKYGPPSSFGEIIQGRVTQKAGAPLANIRVEIPELGVATVTSPDGRYYLEFVTASPKVVIQVTDIDGPANGGDFNSQNVALELNLNGYYEVNLELEPKGVQ